MTRRLNPENLGTHLVLLLGIVVMVVPYLWMVTLSLKPVELTHSPPYLFPSTFEWENYLYAWQSASFARYYWNSAIVAAGITVAESILRN